MSNEKRIVRLTVCIKKQAEKIKSSSPPSDRDWLKMFLFCKWVLDITPPQKKLAIHARGILLNSVRKTKDTKPIRGLVTKWLSQQTITADLFADINSILKGEHKLKKVASKK